MNVSSTLKAGQIDSPHKEESIPLERLKTNIAFSYEEDRAALRDAFLKREGLEKEPLHSLPSDASKRRYFRLSNRLLMDAPPPHESTRSFQIMADLLRERGLNVPHIYASDHEQGFLLIEDFGELTFRKALQKDLSEAMLYEETIKSLLHLHQHTVENKLNLPLYSLEFFLNEAEIFLEWYGLFFSSQAKEDFKGLWTEAYHHQPPVPHSLVLRDVIVDNLMWIPSQKGFKRCGFLDFQDGVWGPITYDLVSLLEDARRDITPSFGKDMLKIYYTARPDLNQDDFWASYNLWGAQRCTKILGIFSRLAKRDEKPQYLLHLPRIRTILERNLTHPSLYALQKWFQSVRL